MDQIIERLRTDLPNFPDEVLSDWLEANAVKEGWPPILGHGDIPQGRWRNLLMGKSLPYWKSIRWEKVDLHISVQELDADSQERVTNLVLAAVAGQASLWSLFIPDSKQRFDRVVEYISEHGRIPRLPSLIRNPEGFSIADGNHRMAAYLYCYGYFRLDLNADLQLKTNNIQSYWVGEPMLDMQCNQAVSHA